MIVQTETAVYVIDELRAVLRRYPRESRPGHDWPVAALRMDTQPIPYKLHPRFPLTVGEPAIFILQIRDDGVETVRTTTPVVSISPQ